MPSARSDRGSSSVQRFTPEHCVRPTVECRLSAQALRVSEPDVVDRALLAVADEPCADLAVLVAVFVRVLPRFLITEVDLAHADLRRLHAFAVDEHRQTGAAFRGRALERLQLARVELSVFD